MLVGHGLSFLPDMTTDINEQNLQALGLYEKMGFKRTDRSPLDGQGRPYPIIYLKYVKASRNVLGQSATVADQPIAVVRSPAEVTASHYS